MTQELALQQFADGLPCGVLGVDAAGLVTFGNPAAAELLGTERARLAGRHVKQVLRLFRQDTAELFEIDALRDATRAGGEQVRGPFLLLDAAARERYVSVSCAADPKNEEQVFLTLVDQTSTETMRARLKYLAESDPVTGLAHRLRLQSHLLHIDQQADGAAWLIYARFFSRAFLLQPGDALLRDLSQLVHGLCAPSETAARVGDHTIAILKRCTISSVTTLADTLLHRTSDYRFAWGTTTFEAKVCIAVVPANVNTCDPWFLTAAGDLFCTEDIANKVRLVTDAELSRAYRLAFDDRGA